MLKATVSLIAAAVVSALCHTAFAGELNRGLFSERNYRLLDKLISENGKRSPNYDAEHRPYVVCGWDNTSAFGDAEETLTYYMLENLGYALSVREFRGAAGLNVPRGESKLLDDAGKPVVFDDLAADYAFIYNNDSGFAGNKSLEKVKASEEYKDFAARKCLWREICQK